MWLDWTLRALEPNGGSGGKSGLLGLLRISSILRPKMFNPTKQRMGDSHDYMLWTTDPTCFNPEATTDIQVSPYESHAHQFPTPPLSNWEDGSWWPPSVHLDQYGNPHASFDQSGADTVHGLLAPCQYAMPNQAALPGIYNPPFTLQWNYHSANPYCPPTLEGPLEAENVQEVRSTSQTATAPSADVPTVNYSHTPESIILPPANYQEIVRDSHSLEGQAANFEPQGNFGYPLNHPPTFNEGHPTAVARSNGDYANAHRSNKIDDTSQITLETRPLERPFILYFERQGKKIWMREELLKLGRKPEEERLEGPVTFSSPVYRVVTCGGKECLPSARNQTVRNNFLRGQLGWIGDCAHKPSFKFEGKRPSVIVSHLVNKERCTLHKTHPDLVQFAEWCRDL
ncbi:hypothetical protein BT69DRAFT_748477 [Atractiella rhizophila]|nr:hypothetical protein BT69DRAFT_748477 [Atractiella rhizophila]